MLGAPFYAPSCRFPPFSSSYHSSWQISNNKKGERPVRSPFSSVEPYLVGQLLHHLTHGLHGLVSRFLDAVFSACTVPISIKTRLGVHDPAEFEALLEIYSRYPVAELTIHPRVRQDFYKGRVREDAFAAALPHCPMPVCYNGDLVSERGIRETIERYPSLSALMLGRGLLGDPSLVTRVRGGERAGSARLQAFHDTLFARYCDAFGDSRIAVLRMKELWFYFGNLFENSEKLQKSIKKAKNAEEFERAAAALFCSCEVRGNAVPAWFRPA